GESHIEFLGSREGIASAKMEITEGLKPGGTVIYDGDEPLLAKLYRQSAVTCGFGEDNDLSISSVHQVQDRLQFYLNGENIRYELPMLGKYQVKNATYAIAAARGLYVPHTEISEALKQLEITMMRFQSLSGKQGSLLVNDAYNASPTSMKA